MPGHHLNLLAMPAVAALAEALGAALAEIPGAAGGEPYPARLVA